MKIYFEPRDCWVGVYWDRDTELTDDGPVVRTKVYVCLVPMVVIRLMFYGREE